MATKEEHLAKADSNATFAKSISLSSQVNMDWAFTTLFYSGLHYVEAYLYKINAPPGTHDTHGKRNRWVATDPELNPFTGSTGTWSISVAALDTFVNPQVPNR